MVTNSVVLSSATELYFCFYILVSNLLFVFEKERKKSIITVNLKVICEKPPHRGISSENLKINISNIEILIFKNHAKKGEKK